MLYKEGEEKPCDFAVYPIEQYEQGYYTKQYSSMSEVLEIYFQKRDMAERMRSRSYALMKTVTSKLDRTKKKLSTKFIIKLSSYNKITIFIIKLDSVMKDSSMFQPHQNAYSPLSHNKLSLSLSLSLSDMMIL